MQTRNNDSFDLNTLTTFFFTSQIDLFHINAKLTAHS